eukprot:g1723.t1
MDELMFRSEEYDCGASKTAEFAFITDDVECGASSTAELVLMSEGKELEASWAETEEKLEKVEFCASRGCLWEGPGLVVWAPLVPELIAGAAGARTSGDGETRDVDAEIAGGAARTTNIQSLMFYRLRFTSVSRLLATQRFGLV